MKFEKQNVEQLKNAERRRQESIVFQNALAHAVQLKLHNSRYEPGDDMYINEEDVIELAKRIARVSIEPNL